MHRGRNNTISSDKHSLFDCAKAWKGKDRYTRRLLASAYIRITLLGARRVFAHAQFQFLATSLCFRVAFRIYTVNSFLEKAQSKKEKKAARTNDRNKVRLPQPRNYNCWPRIREHFWWPSYTLPPPINHHTLHQNIPSNSYDLIEYFWWAPT